MADPLSEAVLVAHQEPVAHARRRFSTASQQSRLHHPSHVAGTQDGASGAAADPDTCRICRGEATADEPLFYPCKCSGSIKYVHQDCLMEWLSHSQKKHCELCKTPFRFTKLYDRRMPQTLPPVVFVSHVAKYLLNNLLVWLRAALVVSMWLIWLPYLMRSIWSLMFWISDEGFGGGGPSTLSGPANPFDQMCRPGDGPASAAPSASVLATGVCPASPLFATANRSGLVADATLDRSFAGANLTLSNPLYAEILHLILSAVGMVDRAAPATPSGLSPVASARAGSPRQPASQRSLLGDVGFFNNLTSLPWLNRNLIYVVEGQIITILVIICFILIILVRDYVVLQQPEINMRAAFAAAAENQPPPRPPPVPGLENPADGLRADEIDALRGPDLLDLDHDDDDDDGEDDEDDEEIAEEEDDAASLDPGRAQDGSVVQEGPHRTNDQRLGEAFALSPIPPYRRRPFQAPADNGEGSSASRTTSSRPGDGSPSTVVGQGMHSVMSQDDVFAPAPARGEQVEPLSAREFTRVYHEANGDTSEMARIFRERGVEARAEHWLRLGRDKDSRMADAPGGNDSLPLLDQSGAHAPTEGTAPVTELEAADSRGSNRSSSGWTTASDWQNEPDVSVEANGKQRVAEPPPDRVESPSASSRGKGKAVEEAPPLDGPQMRPRANTDGPFYRPDGIHPLGNNTWAFPQSSQESGAPSAESSRDAGAASDMRARVRSDEAAAARGGPLQPSPADAQGDAADQDETPAWANLPDFNGVPPTDRPDPALQAQGEGQAASLVDRLADFMWGGVNPADDLQNRARVRALLGDANQDEFELVEVHDGPAAADEGLHEGDEDGRDHVHDHGHDHVLGLPGALPGADQQQRDPEVVREAMAAGMDPEAIEDAEDFEGVMELLGMRGPIAGLFQNAVFCSFLVSVTVFAGIFVPYNIGRVGVWVLANPTRPLRILFSVIKLVQDVALVAGGLASWFALRVADTLSPLLALQGLSRHYVMPLVRASYYMSVDAARRIIDSFTVEPPVISTSEIRNFSAISHEALLSLKANIALVLRWLGRAVVFVVGGDYASKRAGIAAFVGNASGAAWEGLKGLPAVVVNPGSWVISLSPDDAPVAVNAELAYWSGTDRFWAVLCGYLALGLVAALYLHRGRPFSSSQAGQDREASIVDGLNQASGVMKVILIIGIEMLIFPLYCGLLLDVALLPLFEDTTLRSRVLFTCNYPLTSIFVHWFVGTGYMFHFALFVSMCRKIMRKGVLYFIRDPDDPDFHPVRDVLERNVTTQLRKILFSAFVYGALVIVCLGGVVWGLWASLPNVLPIHYSSNEPVLEFPIDLLFYNFLMPLAVKFFRPSDGLHAMYTWWFRKCARGLRVTWFLFGERRVDEEGVLVLDPLSEHRHLPLWRRLFLEVRAADNTVVPKTWHDLFDKGSGKPTAEMKPDELTTLAHHKALLVGSGQLVPDGRFVRAPASDQVKIPKGRRVFLDVSESNARTDGLRDAPETDLYSSDSYQLVYIPPYFRLRIFLFILSIWIFAAVTGVSFTIIPLVFGRRVFKMLIPAHIRTNDIYAFSIGIYVLGSLTYALFHLRELWASVRASLSGAVSAAWDHAAARRAVSVAARAAKLVYSYFFLLIVFPLLITSLMELYCLIPLDTYMYSSAWTGAGSGSGGGFAGAGGSNLDGQQPDTGSRHTVRVIQAWTIGLLYLKLAARLVNSWYEESRPAAALRAVLARGWLNPNAGVLTRAFIIPGLAVSTVAIVGPPAAAHLLLAYHRGNPEAGGDALNPILVYRLSFPAAALGVVLASLVWATLGVFRSWRVRIRDEAYLIGERLHNFGASSSGPAPTPGVNGNHNHPRARVAWREGGAAAA